MNATERRYDLPGVAEAYATQRFQDVRGKRRDEREAREVAELYACIGTHLESSIDVPCGTGRFAGRIPGTVRLAGDLSWEMLTRARERYGEVPLVQCTATRLPLRDGAVDLAFCMRLLHHLRDEARRAVLGELARVAREHAIVSLFLGPSLQGARRRFKEWRTGRRGSRGSISRRRFEQDLAATGWRVVASRARARFVSEQWVFLLGRV